MATPGVAMTQESRPPRASRGNAATAEEARRMWRDGRVQRILQLTVGNEHAPTRDDD